MRQTVADVDATGEEDAMLILSQNRTRDRRLDLNWPTRITLSRILLVAPFVACMLHINAPELTESTRTLLRHVAAGMYLFMAVSDGVDGLLARRRGQLTRLGAFLDPAADKLLMTATCILLVSQRGHVSGFVPPAAVVMAIIGKDILLVAGFVAAYLMTSRIYIAPAFAGKLAMFVQLLMGAAVLLAPELSEVVPAYDGLLSVLWWSAAATAVIALVVYILEGARYIGRCERAPAKGAEVVAN